MQRLTIAFLLAVAGQVAADPEVINVCAACHGKDGSGAGFANVPIIAGTPGAHLEEALYAYQDGARRCVEVQAMCDIAAELSGDQIIELADYYAAMRRISSGEEFDAALATAGERFHEEHCSRCHVLPEDEDVEFALGIPLHGQRSDYLRIAFEAYMTGVRETLVPVMAEKFELLDGEMTEALINYYASYEP